MWTPRVIPKVPTPLPTPQPDRYVRTECSGVHEGGSGFPPFHTFYYYDLVLTNYLGIDTFGDKPIHNTETRGGNEIHDFA